MATTDYTRDKSIVDTQALLRGVAQLPEVLKKMGFSSLRQGQAEIIYNVMGLRDTLGFLPTGQGKSATFIIPAACLNLRTLVFSPLVALMQDQVQSLWRKGLTAGQLSSNASKSENHSTLARWVKGEIQFLYIAPERMKNEDFQMAIAQTKPDMIVVDEAHSISQWGTNFRPQYAKIGGLIQSLNPKVVLAITATATRDVEEEIRQVLHMQSAFRISYLPERKNLKLSSSLHTGDAAVAEMIRKIAGPTIVYCATRKEVERVTQQLENYFPGRVAIYHGQMHPSEKNQNQRRFMEGDCDICVATNAFGMGIDKSDIRGVIHHDFPGSIEALTQEIGRAGRDGKDSLCHTFDRKDARRTQEFFVENGFPSERDMRTIYEVIKRKAKSLNQDFVEMTIKDIAIESGLGTYQEGKVGSALSIMVRNGVIERPKNDDKIGKIRFKSTAASDDRASKYWDLIERYGESESDNFYLIDLDLLSNKVGVTEPTVRKNLRDWQAAGLCDFIPPFRGTPIYLKRDVNVIDFKDLAERKKEAMDRITQVEQYIRTPDSQKAEFLVRYFSQVKAA